MTEPMRVAIFSDTFIPKVDGIVKVVCLFLDHLSARGIETAVFVPKMTDDTHYNQTRIIGVPGWTFPLYPDLVMAPPRPSTYRALRDFDPDVAHFIHPIILGVPSFVMAKQLGIPTVISFHIDFGKIAYYFNVGPLNLGFLHYLADFLTPCFFNWADYSLAPSRVIQDYLYSIGVKEVGLWGRGVELDRFNPRFRDDAMRSRLSDSNPDDVILLYVGRLSIEKRLEHLREVVQAVPNARLALVGDGPAREHLETYFAGTNTVFTGYLTGEDLSRAYASADVFVFPSEIETFGLVVVEAMAAGLPVIASRVGGVPDVITPGENGFIFEPNDVETLVEITRQVASDRERIVQMGRAARAFAETQTWEAMNDEIIDHYKRVAKLKRPR